MSSPAQNPSGSTRRSARNSVSSAQNPGTAGTSAQTPSRSRNSSGATQNPAPTPSSSRIPSGYARNSAPIPPSSRSFQSPAQMASRPRNYSSSAQTPAQTTSDVIGHMFLCHQEYSNSYGDIFLRVNDGGVILQWQPPNHMAQVRVLSRTPNEVLDVPIRLIRIGARQINGPLPVDFQGALHTPITTLSRPVPSAPGNDLRKHIAALLTGMSEVMDRIPFLKGSITRWLESPGRVQEASTLINAGVVKCSPRLIGMLLRKDFTMNDVVNASLTITRDNHTCGVYARSYREFRVSVFFDDGPHNYVGQTIDMNRRDNEHLLARNNPGNSDHYKVSHNARVIQAVQLCELDLYAGGTKEMGEGLRDICEQLFVLFLGAYHPSVLRYRETYAQNTLEQAIAEDYTRKDLARTYSDIAKVSLAKTGFALPGMPNRQRDFGTHGGLNKESPMGMGDRYEKTIWTVQDAGDRWVMQRSSFVLSDFRTIFKKQGITLYGSSNESIDYAQPGDTVFLSVDIMKPNAGEHRSPYFRCPRIGPFNIWHYANKVAFKIVWRSEKDNKFRSYYLQQQHMSDLLDTDTPGGSNLFAMGIALYAFFTRSHWKDKPDFVPEFGKADLLFARTDQFNQTITTKLVADPLVMVPKVESTPTRFKQRELGYENVDGEWKPLKESTRTKCDVCVAYPGDTACVRIGNSNLCVTCKRLGLSCSWTHSAKLKMKNLDAVADLYKLRINVEATQAKILDDPGYLTLGATE